MRRFIVEANVEQYVHIMVAGQNQYWRYTRQNRRRRGNSARIRVFLIEIASARRVFCLRLRAQ